MATAYNPKYQEDKWNAYWEFPNDAPKPHQMIWVRSDGFYMPINNTRNLTKVDQPNPQVGYSISWIAAEDGVQIVSSTLDRPCQPRVDNTSYSFYSGILKEGDEFQIEWVTPAESTFFYSANGTNCTNGMFGGFNLPESDIWRYGNLTENLNGVKVPQGGYYGTTGTLMKGRFEPENSTITSDGGGGGGGGISGEVLYIIIGVGVGLLVLTGLGIWMCISCGSDSDEMRMQQQEGMGMEHDRMGMEEGMGPPGHHMQ